ncbi:selenocysteine-specific translation elongation factor [Halomonas sp. PAMB 3232]|uniref:selenocysteine-specific translation elongation factor n=1 Tax=Halomonas sp. PAMB 3232 TaxID=3075221 RepID=UPI00289F96E1|nr:selenocysteine-specific translation elongation factor [Halomonas sp. PAMB 3232]WNL38582.1 selenocysteine-specific translation elongation factor [Halomonas sp. PAMB 3232]
MILATAGHVDHGKTTLLHALTGVDADTLKEEKSRGLTIEPGFIYPTTASGAELGFIDVPGHERFVHNMLSGVAGVDGALLIIACDDGVMPQTREHLAILTLLSIPVVAVVLTKTDLASDEQILARQREAEALGEGAPVFSVCARQATGVEALSIWLERRAGEWQTRPAPGRFRHAIDRAFSKKGAGVVVTGTVVDGRVEQGDSLWLLPREIRVRVRGLRRQNQPAEAAHRGDRCALNLAGIERESLKRGDWLVDAPEPPASSQRIDVMLKLLPTLERDALHWTPVHIHMGAAHLTGRLGLLEAPTLAPGGQALAQLTLDQPVHACCGDRFVIRSQSADETLGGGRVLDPWPPRRGARRPERLAYLTTLQAALAAGAAEREDGFAPTLKALAAPQPGGISLDELSSTLNRGVERLAAQAKAQGLTLLRAASESRAFDPIHLEALARTLIEALETFHAESPSEVGMERDRLRRWVAPGWNVALFRRWLEGLVASKSVDAQGPFIKSPHHQVALDEADQALSQTLLPLLANQFDPPRVRDLAQAYHLDEPRVREVLHANARLGRLFQLRKDHFYPPETLAQLSEIIERLACEHGAIRAADYRDRTGVGRKLAIAQLEFFDQVGYTRRVRDARQLRQPGMWH